MVSYFFTSCFLFPPREFIAFANYGEEYIHLVCLPPMNCEGEVPPGLLSYNLFMNGTWLSNIPYYEWTEQIFYIGSGLYSFCLSAVYDLTPYGFPGSVAESLTVCDTVQLITTFLEKEVDLGIHIFPNPTKNQLNIQLDEIIEEITLINQFGQIVFVTDANEKQIVVNTAGLEAGVYIVRVTTDKGVLNKRVVIAN